jgi:hypothetical protein
MFFSAQQEIVSLLCLLRPVAKNEYIIVVRSILTKLAVHVTMIVAFIIVAHPVFSQHDSLILKNQDVIVGEIKSLDKGVLTIETGEYRAGPEIAFHCKTGWR